VAEPMGAAMFRTPGEAYDRYIGRYGRELARALIDAAGVGPDWEVLDVGCGPGALTAELAVFVGAGSVAAVDPSDTFVAACRERVPGARVALASAEALPFADGTFDGALAQLVVNFMTDPLAGVREMRRVTRAGGTVAAAVWDYAGEMTLLRRFWDAAIALDPDSEPRDERHMPHCTPDALGELWAAAGLGGVEVTSATVGADYDGFDDLWSPLERGVGPAGAYVAALAPDARAALREELRRRLGAGDAPFRLTARAWIATGSS
jgi:SAM-dependent methyltransferase